MENTVALETVADTNQEYIVPEIAGRHFSILIDFATAVLQSL